RRPTGHPSTCHHVPPRSLAIPRATLHGRGGHARSQWTRAAAVAATSTTASERLTSRDRRGCRRSGASDVPARSHVALIRTIVGIRAAVFAAASATAPAERCALAKTAAIATQAFGFATPSSAPPASDGAGLVAVRYASGGEVAMWEGSQST